MVSKFNPNYQQNMNKTCFSRLLETFTIMISSVDYRTKTVIDNVCSWRRPEEAFEATGSFLS